MTSFKSAIEKVYFTEVVYNKTFCDNKYATFKHKINGEIFNTAIADKIFVDIWLKNKYYTISSQEMANKLLESSTSLSEVITKNMLNRIIKKLSKSKRDSKKDLIECLNELCQNGLEKNIICLLRSRQREYYINMISNRPEESRYLYFFLTKTYL